MAKKNKPVKLTKLVFEISDSRKLELTDNEAQELYNLLDLKYGSKLNWTYYPTVSPTTTEQPWQVTSAWYDSVTEPLNSKGWTIKDVRFD